MLAQMGKWTTHFPPSGPGPSSSGSALENGPFAHRDHSVLPGGDALRSKIGATTATTFSRPMHGPGLSSETLATGKTSDRPIPRKRPLGGPKLRQ
jgi:hypothetical protein